MNERLQFALTLFAAVGSGLIAGAFFAFSTFVMRALGALPTAQGVAAMQSINVTVINPWFMTAFVGTAGAGVVLAVDALWKGVHAGTWLLLVGSLSYVVGCFGVTMVCNVPRNDALAAIDPTSADAARSWASYRTSWTFWNHVRTLAALLAALAFMLELR